MTIVACPHCNDGMIDTSNQQHCPMCGRDLGSTYIIPDTMCGQFFDPGWDDRETRYMCRRERGHEGPHDEHED